MAPSTAAARLRAAFNAHAFNCSGLASKQFSAAAFTAIRPGVAPLNVTCACRHAAPTETNFRCVCARSPLHTRQVQLMRDTHCDNQQARGYARSFATSARLVHVCRSKSDGSTLPHARRSLASSAPPPTTVLHDEIQHRIWVPGPSSPHPPTPSWPGDDGEAAVLTYELHQPPSPLGLGGGGGQEGRGRTVMDIVSTHVPPVHRGRGLAAVLVSHAFAHARAHGYAVRPSCSYVAHTWLGKHGGEQAAGVMLVVDMD